MSANLKTVEIRARFAGCLRFASVLTVATAAGTVGLAWLTALLQGRDSPTFLLMHPVQGLLGLAAMTLGFAIVIYLVAREAGARVDAHGIATRTLLGRRLYVSWERLHSLQPADVVGLAGLLVLTRDGSSAQIVFHGASLTALHGELAGLLGPEHVLTRYFRPAAAMNP